MGLGLSKEIQPYNLDFLDDPEIWKTIRGALGIGEPVSTDLIVSNQVAGNRLRTLASIDIEKENGVERLNKLQIWGARRALTGLVLAESFGYIDFSKVKRILDFGAGMGEGTFALVSVARSIGAEVEAIEIRAPQANLIVETSILPNERVLGGKNGIVYLNSTVDKGIQPYDLITGFMFGPDEKGTLFRQLVKAARKSLSPSGSLLLTSDIGTIMAAEDVCQMSRIDYHRIHGIWRDNDEVAPNVVILPRGSLEGFLWKDYV